MQISGRPRKTRYCFAATLLKLDLTPDKRKQLMEAYLGLQAWPEVPQALQALKSAGIRLAFLSNATRRYSTRASRTPSWRDL